MKKLVLHVGYPKTATTTLQNVVLTKLHEQGKINYFGRSSATSINKSSIAFHLQEYLFLGKPFPKNKMVFREDLVNVLSDEELTSPPLYVKYKHGADVDPLSFPMKIKGLLTNYRDIQVEVVFILRRQPDLMYSWYAQLYRYFASGNESSIDAHTFSNCEVKNDQFAMYNFSTVISSYAQVFGHENVSVHLYENLIHKSSSFFEFWANTLQLPVGVIVDLFQETHLNQKGKKGKNSVVTNTSYTPMTILKALRVIPEPIKIVLRNIPGLKKLISVKATKKDALEVTNYTEDQQRSILNAFLEGNKSLTHYGLSLEELRGYKYIPIER